MRQRGRPIVRNGGQVTRRQMTQRRVAGRMRMVHRQRRTQDLLARRRTHARRRRFEAHQRRRTSHEGGRHERRLWRNRHVRRYRMLLLLWRRLLLMRVAGKRDGGSDDDDGRGVAVVELMGRAGKRRRNSVNHDEGKKLEGGCLEGMRMKERGNSRQGSRDRRTSRQLSPKTIFTFFRRDEGASCDEEARRR